MKKFIIVMLVALLALALVACGGETETTTQGEAGATTPAITTAATPAATNPAVTTTAVTPAATTPVTTTAVTTTAVTTTAPLIPVITTTVLAPANVKLPMEGIKELTVDQSSIVFDKECWAADPPAGAFDGETNDTKLGSPYVDGNAMLEFSLTEAATVTYYTFYTGNDTAPEYPRNPISWILYGKVGDEWVELSNVGLVNETGMKDVSATPFSYAIETSVECKDFKFEFITETVFQLNEIVMYANDATVTTPTAAALLDGAEVLRMHAIAKINKETYEIRTTFYPTDRFDVSSLDNVTARGAYAWVKDTTNNGEWVKYNVELITTSRGLDINFFLEESFVPVAGVKYDMQFYFLGGEDSMFPGKIHAVYEYGFELAQ